tara:strand:+ start:900 stop:1070 length:171 start_codon:yes stop_codon:yes gene_type:complete
VLLPLEESVTLEQRVLERGEALDRSCQEDGHHINGRHDGDLLLARRLRSSRRGRAG